MFGMMPFSSRGDTVFDVFDNFDRFVSTATRGTDRRTFRTDIRDRGDDYLLEAELPGFGKEEIALDLKEGILTITAEHRQESEQPATEDSYLRRERSYSSYSRSFDVSGIDEGAISADYENGVLRLTLPKIKPVEPEVKRIAIQ